MKYLLPIIFTMSCMADIAIGQGRTYSEGKSWVTNFLGSGGNPNSIMGLRQGVTPDMWKFRAVAIPSYMPKHWDWAEVIGSLQPIRNQGSCGSCWAFATTASVETALAIFGEGFSNNLSEQTLVSSCSNSGSCRGGYFEAFDYIRDTGMPWEDQDTYQAKNSSCKTTEKTIKIYHWFYIGQGGRSPTTDELKAAILRYGSIAVGVNGSFGNYSSGIYNNCGRGGVNHMVNLEGWDDDGEYWIMRNSWGESWGEHGRMRIKWTDSGGRKCNRIGSVAAAILLYPQDSESDGLAAPFGISSR